MSTLSNILSQIYRLSEQEVELKVREQEQANNTLEEVELEIHTPRCDIPVVSIDAGCGLIKHRGRIYAIVNVVAICSRPKSQIKNRVIIRELRNVELELGLQVLVRTCELELARHLIEDIGHGICLLDGSFSKLITNIPSDLLQDVLRQCTVITFSKVNMWHVRESRSKLIIVSRSPLGPVYVHRCLLVLGEVYVSSYVEVLSGKPLTTPEIRELMSNIVKLCINSVIPGYPLTLILADSLSKVSGRILQDVKKMLSRVSQEFTIEFSPAGTRVGLAQVLHDLSGV